MATTRSRPHGREHARPAAGGAAAEHATKIYAAAITGIVIIVAFLALTSTGHVIDAATQHFMLFYAGVFALIALCASAGLGLVATDRVFLSAGHRVLAQSAHRAASFGAVTFLIIHIVTEILAQRVHVLDAVVPFLSPFRTFYIGLGTIASDLIILLVITGIMRGRFNAHGRAWRWRAIHYTSYASFVFGVWHGLLAGRPAKPYVDWSYGLLVALVLLALVVRIVVELAAAEGEPVRAAGADVRRLGLRPDARRGHVRAAGGGPREHRRAAAPDGLLGAGAGPVGAGVRRVSRRPDADGAAAGRDRSSWPTSPATRARPATWARPAPGTRPDAARRDRPVPASGHRPDAPRRHRSDAAGGDRLAATPADRAVPGPGTGPMPRAATGPMAAMGDTPSWPSSGHPSGPMPRAATGPFPSAPTGPMAAGGTPSWPTSGHPSGPMPRAATGPFPTRRRPAVRSRGLRSAR